MKTISIEVVRHVACSAATAKTTLFATAALCLLWVAVLNPAKVLAQPCDDGNYILQSARLWPTPAYRGGDPEKFYKCGYWEWTDAPNYVPPIINVYLAQTTHLALATVSNYSFLNQTVTNAVICTGGSDGGDILPGITWTLNYESKGVNLHSWNDVVHLLCIETNVYGAGWSWISQSYDGREWIYKCPYNYGACWTDRIFYYGNDYYGGIARYVPGHGWVWDGSEHDEFCEIFTLMDDCYTNVTLSSTNDTPSYLAITMDPPGPFNDAAWTRTHQEWNGTDGSIETIDLLDCYGDDLFWSNIVAELSVPDPWSDGGAAAYSLMDPTRTWAMFAKTKYRIGVLPGTVSTPQALVTWDEVTWSFPGGPPKPRPMVEIVTLGSDTSEPTFTSEYVLRPRFNVPVLSGSTITLMFVDHIKVQQFVSSSVAGKMRWSEAGCLTCGPTGTSPSTPALSAQFEFGQSALGITAGQLQIASPLPHVSLATPDALTFCGSTQNVEVIQISNRLRQVRAPQALADIVTNTAFAYDIRFYLSSQVGSKVGDTYQLSGSPFVTFRVENPDASPTVTNRIRITETRGSDARVYDAVYNEASGNWTFTSPGGVSQTQVTNAGDGTNVTVLTTVSKPGGAASFKVQRNYFVRRIDDYNWRQELVQEVLDPDTNPKTTTYTHYSGYSYGRSDPIQSVVHPDGSWEYYTYDGSGRKSAVYRSLGDIATPGQNADARRTEYRYDASYVYGSGDDGTLQPDTPRRVVEYQQNVEIARRYTVIASAEVRIDVQTTVPGASWDHTSNLFTTNRYYTSGPNQGRLKSVVRPDGTFETYNYADDAGGNYRTNMTASGQPDSNFSHVVDGTTNATVMNFAGSPVLTKAWNIAGGTLLQQETYSNFDDFGRPGRVTHLDGTQEDTYYACCGVDNTTDRDGVLTQYTYDSMKRLVASTRLGITVTNVLDAAGRTLQTIRIGTNGFQILQSQRQYDAAGRLLSETNALGGRTSYAESLDPGTGELSRTTTYPDGGIRTETYYLDGTLKSVTGTAAAPVRYDYGADTDWSSPDYASRYTKEIKLNADGSDSAEWTITYTDAAGRSYKTIYADDTPADLSDNPKTLSYYNAKGQLWKEVDPDEVITLYTYNAKGEQEYSIVALTATARSITDYNTLVTSLSMLRAGLDRITRNSSDTVTNSGIVCRRTQTFTYPNDNSATELLLAKSEAAVDGSRSWQTTYRDTNTPIVSQSWTAYYTNGSRYHTNIAPDASYTVSRYQNGRLLSVTRKDANNNQLSFTSYAYDAHGRQASVTDARNGPTSYVYNDADLVQAITTPGLGIGGNSALTTLTFYNKMLQATNAVYPDGTGVTNRYGLAGMLTNTCGSRTYPVGYTYDVQGRMKTMTTWTNYASRTGPATTTWNYNAYRGWLESKRYADNTGPDYTYTIGGRLKSRAWARTGTGGQRILTTYTYGFDDGASGNDHGDLVGIAYANDPEATPALTYTYDRRTRQKAIVQGSATTTLAYNDAGELLSEIYSGGTLAGLSVTNGYDQYLRRTDLGVQQSSTPILHHSFSYDAGSRLQTVADGNGNSATYSYLANSPLVAHIYFTNNGSSRMTTSKSYDFLNRLQSISSVPSCGSTFSFNYGLNDASQRVRTTLADGSTWIYQYDALGQVKCGKRYWADWTPVAGQQFEYSHDDIGNRTTTGIGGDQSGANLRYADYVANNLNQYTSRGVTGAVEVTGVSFATNTVQVNGLTACRKGEYFWKELLTNNASGPLWVGINATAMNQSSVTGNVFLAQSPEQFYYDLDGNLTNDGRWKYAWDAENRLVKMWSGTGTGPQQSLNFEYDAKGRRISKQFWGNNSFSGGSAQTNFVYDDWNLMAEIGAPSTVIRTYAWGLDLGGSPREAGGIGGLLEVTSKGTTTTNCFVVFDGNGNAMGLVSAVDGGLLAEYEYGPFGEAIRATGPLAKVNPFRFSTKYQDAETDLLYFGHRYYNTSAARWLSRDPAAENAGYNLYAFVENNPGVDPLGLVALHYIDYPKWDIIEFLNPQFRGIQEYLWVGHYLTFDSSDASRLRPGHGHGTLLIKHTSSAHIKDCGASGTEVVAATSDFYFANRFQLADDGSVRWQDNQDFFGDPSKSMVQHVFFQIGSAKAGIILKNDDNYRNFTKGRFFSVMEVRVLVGDSVVTGEPWIRPTPGVRFGSINSHELGRAHYGWMAGQPPPSWSSPNIYRQLIFLDFSWDDCSCQSDFKWKFEITPALTEAGDQRSRYWDNYYTAQNLIHRPNSGNW